ncbi:VRR-NUC domain-containing protein [Methylomagnum ishizawai]|uniref:VRR-NUC domain-containing protein n=1 Tax=Methylomagnum ishizawai TaxID=1760988 RepID=A0A1Y6CZF3_9GAMM|nr:VRR-NUC domain-containing protein [Methylomagnum ishizawai]SMF96058.1 VRR-NUC domain-containing protein [Methylomagnum ishizawai]
MTAPRRKPRDREHREQAALFEWAELNKARHPDLRLLLAIPNGGDRHPAVAARLRAEGVRPGVPDLCLPVPRGGFHGLWIELKAPQEAGSRPGALEPGQLDWLDALNAHGYKAVARWGWEAARQTLIDYLEGKP